MSNSISLFKEINRRLKEIKLKGIKGPQDEIEDGDNVVGELDEKHKKLLILGARLMEEAKKIFEQNRINLAFQEVSKSFSEGDNLHDITGQLAELSKLIELVKEILWFEIRKDFNLWTKPLIIVRKGWKVVWRERAEDTPSIIRILQLIESLQL